MGIALVIVLWPLLRYRPGRLACVGDWLAILRLVSLVEVFLEFTARQSLDCAVY